MYCSDPDLAMSIIQQETRFRNIVNESEGSTGLMQILPSTAKWIECEAKTQIELMDIEKNIACGCKYLDILQNQHLKAKMPAALGDVISSYNAGSVRFCRTGTLKPSGNKCKIGHYINSDYVGAVVSNLRQFHQEGFGAK
jgi:soluble lytic murein transglycosylase-like protein